MAREDYIGTGLHKQGNGVSQLFSMYHKFSFDFRQKRVEVQKSIGLKNKYLHGRRTQWRLQQLSRVAAAVL